MERKKKTKTDKCLNMVTRSMVISVGEFKIIQ